MSSATQHSSTTHSAEPPQSRRDLGAVSSAASSAAVVVLPVQQQQAQGTAVAEPRGRTTLPGKIILETASSHDTSPNVARHDHEKAGQTSVYFGNWGTRAVNPKTAAQRNVHNNNVAQILKSPCHIVTLAEANALTSDDLQMGHTPQSRRNTGHKFDQRKPPEDRYYVFRGDDANDVLIAVRRSIASELSLLQHDCNLSAVITDHGKQKEVQARVMMCDIEFKRHMQCIGKSLGVAVVHLHYAIAKMSDNAEVYKRFWDNLAADLRRNNIRFMSGDFNMALTKVVPELRSRGITADLCAWYPYFASNAAHDQTLHLDSCAIFVIGGNAAVQMPWDERHMHTFASHDTSTGLPIYDGAHPGQSWKCYRPLNLTIPNLLGPLLERNFIAPVAAAQNRTYLRVKQKQLARDIWELDGRVHGGAHFPLAVYTVGNSFRSATAAKRRHQTSHKKKGEDAAEDTAVAEPEAAHTTAVADAIPASASAVADASDPNGDDYVGSNVCRYPALSGAAERLKTHRYA